MRTIGADAWNDCCTVIAVCSAVQVYHFVCHVLALLCVAVGLSSAIVYHTRIYVQHMRSLHSWMGIGTMGLYCLQFVFGFFAYCWPKLGFGPRKASLPTHQVRGEGVDAMDGVKLHGP